MAKWQPMLSGLLLKYIRRFFKLTPLPHKIFLEHPMKILVVFLTIFSLLFSPVPSPVSTSFPGSSRSRERTLGTRLHLFELWHIKTSDNIFNRVFFFLFNFGRWAFRTLKFLFSFKTPYPNLTCYKKIEI